MDEPVELSSYLPLSFYSTTEQDYFTFLWDAYETNYVNGNYQFAFLAYHMLAMSFIYFNIWQIKKAHPQDFAKGLIGFANEEKNLIEAQSPFAFSMVRERTVLRFLKLIACDDGKISSFVACVRIRNDIAHAKGNIFFRTQSALDKQISEILRAVDYIQSQSKPVIEYCYREFLLQSHASEDREYPNISDQVREVLIKSNYMSLKDVEICTKFDIEQLGSQRGFADMRDLHHGLLADYNDNGLDTA